MTDKPNAPLFLEELNQAGQLLRHRNGSNKGGAISRVKFGAVFLNLKIVQQKNLGSAHPDQSNLRP